MKRNTAFTRIVVLAVSLLVGISGTTAMAEGIISSTDEFASRLEEEYKDIANFSASLSLSGLDPPVSIEVLAITEPRSLRVEYLSPDQMKGQFFLLEDDFLYQYMPGRNLIIKKDLDESDMPVEAANLTPEYLLELVRSEDLEVTLIGTPVKLYRLGFAGSDPQAGTPLSHRTGSENSLVGLGFPSRIDSAFDLNRVFGHYVVEIIPETDKYEFSRQIIQFDPGDFLPRELITCFDDQDQDTVYTTVEEVSTNRDIDLEEVTKLPEDAEVIED